MPFENPQQFSAFCIDVLSLSSRDFHVCRRTVFCSVAGAASTATDTLNMRTVETPRMTMYCTEQAVTVGMLVKEKTCQYYEAGCDLSNEYAQLEGNFIQLGAK